MLRVPKQSASIDLYENLFGSQQYCQGVTYRGPGSLDSLILNPVDGPSFCTPDHGFRTGAFFSGLGL